MAAQTAAHHQRNSVTLVASCAALTVGPNRLSQKEETSYVTTFCNWAHRLADGVPEGHECYILPPRALLAERDGDFETAARLLRKFKRKVHKGT